MPNALKGARCLIWQADVRDYDGVLDWKLKIQNAEEAMGFLRLKIPEGRDYSSAFYRAKLLDDAQVQDQVSREAIRGGQTSYQQEFRLKSEDDQILWFREVVNIRVEGPSQWFLTGVCIDITDHHEAQEAVLNSERRYRALFESNPLPMWMFDRETLAFLDVNAAAIKHYGYSRDEFLSLTLRDIRPAEDIPALLISVANSAENPVRKGVFRHRKADGSLITVEISTHDLPDISSDCHRTRVTTVNDVTERLAAAQALEESQRNLARAQELANIGSWTFDINQNKNKLSHECLRIIGAEPDRLDLLWKECVQYVHNDDRSLINLETILDKTISGPQELDLRIVRPTGEIRYVRMRMQAIRDLDGKAMFLEGTMQDITERKLADDELKWKSALLEAQLNSSIDGVLVVDTNGLNILRNKRFDEIWGFPKEVLESGDDELQLDYVRSLTKDPSVLSMTIEHRKRHPNEPDWSEFELKDGRVLDEYSAPVFGSDGVLYGRLWSFRDVTRRKQAEHELRWKSAFLEAVLHSSSDGVAVSDTQGEKLFQNRQFNAMWRVPREQVESNNTHLQQEYTI